MVLIYSIHQHIVDHNWVGLEVDLCLTATRDTLKECQSNGDLPIHMAIKRNAPEKLILDLIRIYPACCTRKNRVGDLPLHVCAKHGSSTAVISALLMEYPEALNSKTFCKISGRLMTAGELARNNSLNDRHCKEVFNRPISHWVSLSTHQRVMRERAFEETMLRMKGQLKQSRENEEKLLKRLNELERRLEKLETSSRTSFVNLDKKFGNKLDKQNEHILVMRNDITTLVQQSCVERKKHRNDTARRVSSASMVAYKNYEHETRYRKSLELDFNENPVGRRDRYRRASYGDSPQAEDFVALASHHNYQRQSSIEERGGMFSKLRNINKSNVRGKRKSIMNVAMKTAVGSLLPFEIPMEDED